MYGKIKEYADLVKFEHTIFALPFALSAMLLACPVHQWPSPLTVLWILLAMVGGRTYAMGLNRLLDAQIDAKNPRTKTRGIPAGRVQKQEAWLLTATALILLLIATFQLPSLCQLLLPVAILILSIYSLMKRFSAMAHLVLGLALGSSAVGGWVAVTGQLGWLPILFGLSVVFWVAGFDIIYACLDVDFDRAMGLHSMPSRLGIRQALRLSRLFHVLTLVLLGAFITQYPVFFPTLWIGWLLTGGMLCYEHLLIQGKGEQAVQVDKINEAFFTINGKISLAMFILVFVGKILG